jgi:hypothetical protein
VSIQKLEAGFDEINDVGETEGALLRASINCNPMIMCQPNRMNSARAVARFASNGHVCTGTLLNSENNNGRAFFLTAFHCIDVGGGIFGWSNGEIDADEEAALANARFQFQFWRTTCNGTVNNTFIHFTGAVIRAAWKNSDVVLLELINPPGVGDGVNYAGWNRQTNAPSDNGSYIIHHPRGEDMRVTSTRSVGHWFWNNMFWTAKYSSGTVTGGSSGSALFNEMGQVVGQLRGGWSSCNYTDFGDRYGKFNHSWNGAGLQQWLSPNQGLQNIETLVLSPMQIRSFGDVNCTSSTTFFVPNLLGCSYVWTTSSNLQIVSGQNTPTVSVMAIGGGNSTGTLSVTITDTKGRNRTLTVTNQVTIALPVQGEFSINGNYGNFLNNYNWVYGVTKARLTTPGIISTDWYFDSGDWPVYYQNNPGGELEFLIEGDQTASFRAISQTNCGTQYNVYTFHRDGIYSYRIAPNPTTNTLTLSVSEQPNKKGKGNFEKGQSIREIIILDKLGNIVMNKKYPPETRSINLFVGGFRTDVYTVKIFNGSTWTSQKFVKQ